MTLGSFKNLGFEVQGSVALAPQHTPNAARDISLLSEKAPAFPFECTVS
jgi:hypothetical protein